MKRQFEASKVDLTERVAAWVGDTSQLSGPLSCDLGMANIGVQSSGAM